MNTFEILLSKRWIVKESDKNLYYNARDDVPKFKKFFTEKLGYQLIVNPHIIKLEKIPASPVEWGGIPGFTDKIHYVFLCIILMFLEDKDAEEQFILSQLLEFIQMNYEGDEIDWTRYTNRKNLVKVIKTMEEYEMLTVDDGSQELFMNDDTQEVLYKNTGISSYFMRNFAKDIQDFNSVEDFSNVEWTDMDEQRGIVRRHRVYRKLLTTPAVYNKGEGDEDFAYIKNFRKTIKSDLNEFMDCELDVYRTGAYVIMGEGCNGGKTLPSQSVMSDIVLLVNNHIRNLVESGKIEVQADESILMGETDFRVCVESCREVYGSLFSKTYQKMTTTEFYEKVKDYMGSWSIIEVNKGSGADLTEQIVVGAISGRIVGDYSDEMKKRIKNGDKL